MVCNNTHGHNNQFTLNPTKSHASQRRLARSCFCRRTAVMGKRTVHRPCPSMTTIRKSSPRVIQQKTRNPITNRLIALPTFFQDVGLTDLATSTWLFSRFWLHAACQNLEFKSLSTKTGGFGFELRAEKAKKATQHPCVCHALLRGRWNFLARTSCAKHTTLLLS